MTKWLRFDGASDEQVNWGGGNDPRDVLEVGKDYEVQSIEVHSWHTRVQFKGIPGWFNSVCFSTPTPAPAGKGET